jgi:hypothetical protein
VGSSSRRAVVREHRFEHDLAAAFDSIRIGDEFVAGAEALLSLEPESGVRSAPDSNVWLLPMAPHNGKCVYLFYTFNEAVVFLIGLAVE